jgi:peptidylprolyl isomerase
MLSAIYGFASALKDSGPDAVGFLSYSGHGVASQGENYLIPIDVAEPSTLQLSIQGVKQSEVMAILRDGAPNAAHYLVLDACRNNLKGARGGKGFVAVGQQSGVLVAFSTEPGSTASDIGDGSGPYAAALSTELRKPGQTDLIMFHNVRIGVMDKTKSEQVPWTEDGIQRRERPIFARAAPDADRPHQLPPALVPSEAERAWAVVKDTRSSADLEAFIRRYGESFYADLARARIEELKKTQLAVAPTATPATSAVSAALDQQNTLLLDTKYGRVVIKLRPDLSPKHAERLKLLASEKFYDNVPFHRVIDGFMAQTGDGQRGDGTGGSKYPNLSAEFSNVPFMRGTVGMARTSDPNSANSQFFIMFASAPNLNGQYTVVGEVVGGMEAVDKIKKGERVIDPDRIIRMRVAVDAK